jgi:hypothetical protein
LGPGAGTSIARLARAAATAAAAFGRSRSTAAGSADSQTSQEISQRHTMSPPPSVFDHAEPVLAHAGLGVPQLHLARRRVGHDGDPQEPLCGPGDPR